MQAGKRRPKGRHTGTVVIALITVNLSLWALLGADAIRHERLDNVALLSAAVIALAALVLASWVWHQPRRTLKRMLAVPSLRYALATHQAGHIVAAHFAEPARVRQARLTSVCDHHTSVVPAVTESALRAELMICLGGMTAEEIFTGESGVYSAADVTRATDVAARMVAAFAMGASAVSLSPAYKTRRKFVARVLEDPRTRKDLEAILSTTKQDTTRVMLAKRDTIIALRDALLRYRRLDREQIRSIIKDSDRGHRDNTVLVDLRAAGGNKPAPDVQRRSAP